MKNKIIALILAVGMLASFSGCVKKEKKENVSSVPPASSEPVVSEPLIDEEMPVDVVVSSEPTSSQEEVKLIPTLIDGVTVDLSIIGDLENEKKGWGQGVQVDEFNRPLSCDSYQEKYGEYGGIFIMPNDEDNKTIYLTFDEGYENGYTGAILDVLKEKECPAVFFVTMPYVKSNPELIKRMIDEGHVIGNHSVKHKSMPTLDMETAINEIAEIHNYMVENYNYQMTLFRPPMGEWSTKTMALAQQMGYKTVLWSYAYKDYLVDDQMPVELALPKVQASTHNGAVYLLHAVSRTNSEILGELIDTWRNDGYLMGKLQ